MQNFKTQRLHWNYFLAIEEDLEKISRYIEFSEQNMKTYSIELAHILLSASSEVDTIMKQICKLFDPNLKVRNIDGYRNVIQLNLSSLIDEEFSIDRFGLKYRPWERWNNDKNPDWWLKYTKVKHQRNEFFQEANLVNTINAVGALLIAQVYYYRLAFSKEAEMDLSFRETTHHLSPEATFVRMSEDYYCQHLVTD